jgi:hypothetical protein
MLIVIMLSVIMLSGVRLNVIMLSVVELVFPASSSCVSGGFQALPSNIRLGCKVLPFFFSDEDKKDF